MTTADDAHVDTSTSTPSTDSPNGNASHSAIFPDSVYAERIERAQRLAKDNDLSALVFSSGVELDYLIGTALHSHERLTALVIRPDSVVLVAPTVERGEVEQSFVERGNIKVQWWIDGDNPHEIVASHLPSGTVGVGQTLTADHLIPLQAYGHRWVLAGPLLRELFMRKDQAEIEQLTKAGEAIDRVHAQVPGLLAIGRTEREIADDLEKLILAEHQEVDFIIVGSGPNGANPHHDYSDRQLADGDIVVVDIGGTYNGYHSDCTRTYVVGKASAERQKVYEVLQSAQAEAVAAAKPGVEAQYIDHVARSIIEEAGYGDQFIHRTGHGIGLSTHEEPFIMQGNDLILEPGMAFSIEPGIYCENDWGARIEDIMIVTEDGAMSVNNQPHHLVPNE